jgi:hypothetical protein
LIAGPGTDRELRLDEEGEFVMMQGNMAGAHLIWMLILALIVVIPFWRICQKAGYPGILGILSIVPVANIALIYFLAFAKWPSQNSAEDTGAPS